MHSFVRELITEWRRLKLPFEGSTLLVAVSGGADSMSLLLALADLAKRGKLRHRIVAAHFDHRLRPDSAVDLQKVREMCGELGVELVHDKAGALKGNVEASAREARYSFLLSAAEKVSAGYVLTAHTQNDQAETLLLNLIRGSGIEGLGGIRPIRELSLETAENGAGSAYLPSMEPGIVVVRPLVRWATRRSTEGFCAASSSDFCRDPMNDDMNLRRVWIRKALIPMIADYNPKIIETLASTAELLQSSLDRLNELGPTAVQTDEPELALADLRGLEEAELADRLRNWLEARRGGLSGVTRKHLSGIANLVATTKSGRVAEIAGGAVVKTGGKLRWETRKAKKG